MIDDTDDVFLGSAAQAESEESSNDDIALPADADDADPSQGPRVRGPRERPRQGNFGAWLVGIQDTRVASSPRHVFGVADCTWHLKDASAATAAAHAALAGPEGRRPGRATSMVWGHLEYTVEKMWALETPVALDDTVDLSRPTATAALQTLCSTLLFVGGLFWDDVLGLLAFPIHTVFMLARAVVLLACQGPCPIIVCSVPLAARVGAGVLLNLPPLSLIKHVRSQLGHGRRRLGAAGSSHRGGARTRKTWHEIVTALPVGWSPPSRQVRAVGNARLSVMPADPLALLRALDFKQYLRSGKFFKKALNAAYAHDHPDAPPRIGDKDESRSALDRAEARADIVDMLVERRYFEADYQHDRIASIHLWSDSSPVTGEELQGMVMDVMYKDHTSRRTVLPGASLLYSQFSAIAKAMCLVWALYLVAGPFYDVIRYAIDKVISITTDHGVELRTLELPDVLQAFLEWNMGRALADCHRFVNHDVRLFRNALRISGWGHAWGNLAKLICAVCPSWPHILDQMRTLVSFFAEPYMEEAYQENRCGQGGSGHQPIGQVSGPFH